MYEFIIAKLYLQVREQKYYNYQASQSIGIKSRERKQVIKTTN
jgi:hypothetical protein